MIQARPVPSSDARTWAMLCHLAALAIFTSVPFGNVLGPLIVYMLKRDDDPFIAEQGKQSLNSQITVTIIGSVLLVAYITGMFVVVWRSIGPAKEGLDGLPWPLFLLPLLLGLAVYNIISIIIGAVRSYNGDHFRYPLSIPFVR